MERKSARRKTLLKPVTVSVVKMKDVNEYLEAALNEESERKSAKELEADIRKDFESEGDEAEAKEAFRNFLSGLEKQEVANKAKEIIKGKQWTVTGGNFTRGFDKASRFGIGIKGTGEMYTVTKNGVTKSGKATGHKKWEKAVKDLLSKKNPRLENLIGLKVEKDFAMLIPPSKDLCDKLNAKIKELDKEN